MTARPTLQRSLLTTIKRLTIATRLYRPARLLSRRMRPHQLREFRSDVKLYRSLLPPGALCFDVGANVGKKSEAMLQAGSRVVSFEPNPAVLPELRACCGRRNNFVVVEAAVGSAAAVATLYARETHGVSSLLQEWEEEVSHTHQVPMVTLDSSIQRFGRPYYCKIDVEGWELEVLKGLTQSIPLLSFEFHLIDQEIRKTISCLERLAQFGSGRVNVTPAESAEFHLKEWMPLGEFLKWFPGDLEKSLPGKPYGDIFVKSDAA